MADIHWILQSLSFDFQSLVEGPESPMTRGGSPAGSLTKKHNVLSPVAKVNNENNIDRKASRIQMGKGSLMNDVTQIWTFYDPPPLLSHKNGLFTYILMPNVTKVLTPSPLIV